MEQLLDALKKAFANTHAMYVKSHGYHWNGVGNNFPQYHAFFETIYSEVYGAIDGFAEHIRAYGGYAPASYTELARLADIQDELSVPPMLDMIQVLYADNQTVMNSLRTAYEAAEAAGEIGLSNYLQDRYDMHTKHAWQLRSTLRVNP
jgi:starvation-inducible DNA-binding protein